MNRTADLKAEMIWQVDELLAVMQEKDESIESIGYYIDDAGNSKRES